MSFKPQTLVDVYYHGEGDRCLVGRLLLKDHRLFFEYDRGFIRLGLELSPYKLPLQTGVIAATDRTFDGLFGLFNDSLPDGWGRLLLDRKLLTLGLNPRQLSPLDRLCCVGSQGMGALSYEPATPRTPPLFHENLDEIYAEIQRFQASETPQFLDDLLTLAGSSAGARPKILISIAGQAWLVKFRSSSDLQDSGPIEYAYHLMAQASGIEIPEAKLFPARTGYGYFAVKRFDRQADRRIHMHSLSGLLHADHREPCLDYEMIMKATRWLTQDVRECEKQFRQAVFNVLSHNRDDHAKNFAYLMDEKGLWQGSPAYDLTFSTGPSGEHCTMIMGEGKNPALSQLLQLSRVGEIKTAAALEIIDTIKAVTAQWEHFAARAGVSQLSTKMIKNSLDNINKLFAK